MWAWGDKNIVAPNFLEGLDKTHISRASPHHDHILFNT
jgi:hypothetical protein